MTLLFQGVISSMLSMHLLMQAGRFESTRKMEELLLRAMCNNDFYYGSIGVK